MNEETRTTYKVMDKRSEAAGITTIQLHPVGISRPEFISGQFITVYLPEAGAAEGKAYSISSAPREEGFSITVKDIGAYSHRLSTMEVGDTLVASGPYGFFYSEEPDTPLVLLAGGIGIAPFRSIIIDVLEKYPTRPMSLYYSVKDTADAAFLETLTDLSKTHSNFTYTVHVTQGTPSGAGCRGGRISVDRIAHVHKNEPKTEYLMCGSIAFVRDMWRGLRTYGIPEERLYTEAFFA